ncbi:MAG: hypothetical protein ACRD4R_01445 [Candidatus Acidiferrales bacterium]
MAEKKGQGWIISGRKQHLKSAIEENHLGTMTSPHTFGNFGAGSSLYWVDPELDLTFVLVSRA